MPDIITRIDRWLASGGHTAAGLVKEARNKLIEDGWQPLDMPPPDGELVDLWVEGFRGKRRLADCSISGGVWYVHMDGKSFHLTEKVTHWRRIPGSPQTERYVEEVCPDCQNAGHYDDGVMAVWCACPMGPKAKEAYYAGKGLLAQSGERVQA